MKKLLAILIISLCFASPAIAVKNLYVSQNGAGSNFTTDCATGSHSAAWFNTAGSWGGDATTILAGDTVHLCDTITTSLIAQDGGSAGSPITILFESGAKISEASCNEYCLSTNSKAYLLIDGGTNGIIEATSQGSSLGSTGYSIGIQANGSSNTEIKNLLIRNMFIRTTATDYSPASSHFIPGITFSGSNIKVHDNVVHDCGWALVNFYGNNDTGVEVYNNDISASGHSYALAGASGQTTQGIFKYYNNYTHDYKNWDSAGCGAAHTSGIHLFGNVNGSKIYGTGEVWIYNNRMTGNGVCSTGQIFTETGGSAWTDAPTSTAKLIVFNNLLLAGPDDLGQNVLGLSGGVVEAYNNTVIGNNAGTCTGITTANTSAKIKNNYFANCSDLMVAYANAIYSDSCNPDLTANYTKQANATLVQQVVNTYDYSYRYGTSSTSDNLIGLTAAIPTIIGQAYRFQVAYQNGDVSGKSFALTVGTSLLGSDLGTSSTYTTGASAATAILDFIATTTTSYLTISSAAQNYGGYILIDNFSIYFRIPPAAFELDYNAYATCSWYNCFVVAITDTGSFASYRSGQTTVDTYSYAASPLTGTGGITAATGLPASDAITVGHGIDLSSLCIANGGTFPDAFCSDRNGVARNSTWDIGAYQYAAEGADVTAPVVTAFTIPATANSLTVAVSSFTCTDAVGVTGYCVSTTNSSAGCSWAGSAQSTVTFSVAGAQTAYGWCKDAATNISDAVSDGVVITLPNQSFGTTSASGSGRSMGSTAASGAGFVLQ